MSNAHDDGLPPFPRPDLPESHPENFRVLRIRVLRRLGLPDDGQLRLGAALSEDNLRSCNGVVLSEGDSDITLGFASLADAVTWAEAVTATGQHRSMVRFTVPPASPYQAVTLTVLTGACAVCATADLVDRQLRYETRDAAAPGFDEPERCERCGAMLCDSCAAPPSIRHDRPGTEQECLPAAPGIHASHEPVTADNLPPAECNHPDGYVYCGQCLLPLGELGQPCSPRQP